MVFERVWMGLTVKELNMVKYYRFSFQLHISLESTFSAELPDDITGRKQNLILYLKSVVYMSVSFPQNNDHVNIPR